MIDVNTLRLLVEEAINEEASRLLILQKAKSLLWIVGQESLLMLKV